MTARSATVAGAIQRLASLEALQLDVPPPTASGRDLSGDHPLFALDAMARDEARAALDRGETHYADVPGIAPLLDAVAATLTATGLPVDAGAGLIITAGEQEGRFLALQTLAQAGYRIVLPTIVHPGAGKAASVGRAAAQQLAAERLALDPATMQPSVDAVRRALAPGKIALYLESPNRLTGKILERPIVEAIAEEVRRTDAMIVWDAALVPWVPDEFRYAMMGVLPGTAERVLTLGTLWTGSGLEGWLAAYLAGPPTLFGQTSSLKQIIAICTTTPAQWGVLGALKSDAAGCRARRDTLLRQKIEAVRQFPGGALPGETASILAVKRPPRLADLSSLPARPMPGEPFGAHGILRFTVTPTGEVIGALRALAAMESP